MSACFAQSENELLRQHAHRPSTQPPRRGHKHLGLQPAHDCFHQHVLGLENSFHCRDVHASRLVLDFRDVATVLRLRSCGQALHARYQRPPKARRSWKKPHHRALHGDSYGCSDHSRDGNGCGQCGFSSLEIRVPNGGLLPCECGASLVELAAQHRRGSVGRQRFGLGHLLRDSFQWAVCSHSRPCHHLRDADVRFVGHGQHDSGRPRNTDGLSRTFAKLH
mmetsp:Transcript_48219/g.103266  ORF Transcript_48219/g.103266 Transcript_48219/m.103266 type:complete len:221 (+) Transcript_48219:1441-2103(+)